jgi:O-antigen/teichoic acid export membrane protein
VNVESPSTLETGPPGSPLVRNFLTLGAGELVSRVLGFGGTIWIARQLGTDGYGIYGFAFAVMMYFAAVGDLGMEHLGPREVADRRIPLARLASSMVFSRFIASAMIALLMAVFGLLAMKRPDGVVLAIFGLTLLPMGATTRWVHLGLEQTREVSVSRLIAELIRVTLLVATVHGPADLVRAPLAHFTGEATAAGFLFVMLRRRGVRLGLRIDGAVIRDMLRRGSPLLLTNLLALVIYNADVVVLGIFRGESEVGLYLAAYTLINFVGVLGNTATLVAIPSLSRLRGSGDRGMELFRTSIAQVVTIGLPVAVGGAMLAPGLIDLLFGAGYAAASPILRLLLLSIPVLLVRSVLQASLIAASRQDRVLHTTAWAATVTLIGDLVLIPIIGMTGAALVTVAAETTRVTAAAIYAAREGYDGVRPARFVRAIAAAAVMASAIRVLRGSPVWLTIPVAGLVWALTLFSTGGLRWRERTLQLNV